MASKYRFYRTTCRISDYSSEENKNWNKTYSNQRTFLLMTSVEETSYFEVAPPGYTIAYKNIDNLSKNKSQILYFVIKSENRIIKKCSKF